MGGRALTGAMEIVAFGALVCFLFAISSFLVLPTPAYAQSNSPPQFSDFRNNRTAAENLPIGSPVGDPVTATDADNDTLTYSLHGRDSASFAIAASTGQLRTSTALDYETKNGYTVTVTATDTASASDTITVTDVPDVPLAASLNNLEMVKLLLGAGAEVHIFDNRRYTPLHNAVYNPDLEVAGFLLDNGAQLHVAGSQGETPLASAMFPGRGEMVELLLDRGADIRWAPEEEWPLHT